MTEKRFEWDVCVSDAMFYDNGAVIDYDDVVDLLNKLSEENEQLKQALREQLEDNGNAYIIEIMDKLFKLDYDKWDEICDWDKRCPYDWEEMVK